MGLLGVILLAVAVMAGGLITAIWLLFAKGNGKEAALRLESRLEALTAAQNEIAGRFTQALAGQTELQTLLQSRIDALDLRLGTSLKETAEKTAETLGGIQTRLSLIDSAQKNIADLSGQVVSLQEIFANKQARGAFGQQQMESIIADALPAGLYEFQAQLSNGCRPDCVIRLPGTKTVIVIDSKFPLESFAWLRSAGDGERKAALAKVRADVLRHVKDIAGKYLLPGETQAPAIMFVPSESIYADLHEFCPELIREAQKAQVVVVSPNILMLAVLTVQTVMKDARMREQANLIQKEVSSLLNDVRLLNDRVNKLQSHFAQADTDIKNILISTGKIASRAEKIEKVELSPGESAPQIAVGR